MTKRNQLAGSARTFGALALGAAFFVSGALGCGPNLTRVQVEQYRQKGKTAVMVAPVRHTLHNLVGIGGGEDKFAQVYGGRAPWRGDRMIAVTYIGRKPFVYPIGFDMREIALSKLKVSVQKHLGLPLVSETGSSAWKNLSRETYWSVVSGDLLELKTDETRRTAEWKALAAEGISSLMIVEVRDAGIRSAGRMGYFNVDTGRVGAWIGLKVIDTATGKFVHDASAIAGKDVPWAEVAPFFPAVNHPETIFGIADEVIEYHRLVSKDAGHLDRLRSMIEEQIGAAIDGEVAKMAQ